MTIFVTAKLVKTRDLVAVQIAKIQATPVGAEGEFLGYSVGPTSVVDPGPSLPLDVSVEIFPEPQFLEAFPTPEDRKSALTDLLPDQWVVATKGWLVSSDVVENPS